MKNLTLFIVLSLFTHLVFAETWKLAKESDGIQVYTRNIPNSDIKEFKGISKMQTSMDSLMAVWDDTNSCPKWFHQCKKPLLIKKLDFNNRYLYQISDFPFPASDRDILTHMIVSRNKATKAVTIEMKNAAHYCKGKTSPVCKKINASSEVRVVASDGKLQFQPLKAGGIKVIWRQYIEPAGKLPDWLVNAVVVDMPFKTLTNLAKLAKTKKYQQAKLKFDAQGQMVGFINKSW